MTRSLVTGGSGYFGSLLVEALAARGDEVRVLDLHEFEAPDPQSSGIAEVEVVLGDVRDPQVVRAACEGVDVVFHNVAQVPLAKDPVLLQTVNIDGTENVLRACEDAGVTKVVHTSSSAVFGVPEHNPVLPSTAPAPERRTGGRSWLPSTPASRR